MIFGHNTNVAIGNVKYHVQTEDGGITSAHIDTTVYSGGRVLHRRTNSYLDLLPLNADREEALKAAGIDLFVFAGCDALAALSAAHQAVGLVGLRPEGTN